VGGGNKPESKTRKVDGYQAHNRFFLGVCMGWPGYGQRGGKKNFYLEGKKRKACWQKGSFASNHLKKSIRERGQMNRGCES